MYRGVFSSLMQVSTQGVCTLMVMYPSSSSRRTVSAPSWKSMAVT